VIERSCPLPWPPVGSGRWRCGSRRPLQPQTLRCVLDLGGQAEKMTPHAAARLRSCCASALRVEQRV